MPSGPKGEERLADVIGIPNAASLELPDCPLLNLQQCEARLDHNAVIRQIAGKSRVVVRA